MEKGGLTTLTILLWSRVGHHLRTRGGGRFIEPGDRSDRAVADLFSPVAAANKAGKAALKQLLAKLNT